MPSSRGTARRPTSAPPVRPPSSGPPPRDDRSHPFRCEECGRSFRLEVHLRIHQRTHTHTSAATSALAETGDNGAGAGGDSEQCIICCDRSVTHMLLPCNHASFCRECVLRLDDCCPLCRANIHSRRRIGGADEPRDAINGQQHRALEANRQRPQYPSWDIASFGHPNDSERAARAASIAEADALNAALLNGYGLPNADDLPAAMATAAMASNNEQRLRRQMAGMRTRIGELWAEVRRQVAEVSDLREENTGLKENIREGNRRLRQLQTSSEEHEDLLQIKEREVAQLRAGLGRQESQSNELQGALDSSTTEVAELRAALDEKNAEAEKLEQALEHEALRSHELQQERDQAMHVQQLCRDQKKMQLRYKAELETCQAELERVKRTAAAEKRKAAMDLHAQLAGRKSELEESEAKRTKAEGLLEAETKRWAEMQGSNEAEKARLVEELEDRLVVQLEELQQEQSKSQQLEKAAKEAKATLSAQSGELAKQKQVQSELRDERDRLSKQVQELLQLDDETAEKDGEGGDRNPLKCLQDLEVGQMRLVWGQIQTTKKNLRRAQQERKAAQQEAAESRRRVCTLEEEQKALREEHTAMGGRCTELEAQLQKNHLDCEKIRKTGDSLQQHARTLETQYQKVLSKYTGSKKALEEQTKAHKQAQQDLRTACTERDDLALEVAKLGKGSGSGVGAGEGTVGAESKTEAASVQKLQQRCAKLQEAKAQLSEQLKKLQQQTLSHCLTLRAVERKHKEELGAAVEKAAGAAVEKAVAKQQRSHMGQLARLEEQCRALEAAGAKRREAFSRAAGKEREEEHKLQLEQLHAEIRKLGAQTKEQASQLDEQRTTNLELQRAFTKLQTSLEQACLEREQQRKQVQEQQEQLREQAQAHAKDQAQAQATVQRQERELEQAEARQREAEQKEEAEQQQQQGQEMGIGTKKADSDARTESESETRLKESEIECEQLRRANSVMFKTVQSKGRAWKQLQEQVETVEEEKAVLQREVQRLQEKHRQQQQQRKEQRLVESAYREETVKQTSALEAKVARLEAQRRECEHGHVPRKKMEAAEERRVAAELRATEQEKEKTLVGAKLEQERVLHSQLKQQLQEKTKKWKGTETHLRQLLNAKEARCAKLEESAKEAAEEATKKAATAKTTADQAREQAKRAQQEQGEAMAKLKGELKAKEDKGRRVEEEQRKTEKKAQGRLREAEEALEKVRAELSESSRRAKENDKRAKENDKKAKESEKRAKESEKARAKLAAELEESAAKFTKAKAKEAGAREEAEKAAAAAAKRVTELEADVAERAAEKGRHLEALTAARVEKSRALKALAASQRVQKVMEGLSREQESEKDGGGEGKHGTKKGEKGKGAGGLTMESCRGCLELHELRGKAEGVERIKESLRKAMAKSERQAKELRVELKEQGAKLADTEAQLKTSQTEAAEQAAKAKALEAEAQSVGEEAAAAQAEASEQQRQHEVRVRQYAEQAELLRSQLEATQGRASHYEAEVAALREANSLGEHVWQKAERERGRLERETRVLEEEVTEQSRECAELQRRNRQLRRELLTVHSYVGVSVGGGGSSVSGGGGGRKRGEGSDTCAKKEVQKSPKAAPIYPTGLASSTNSSPPAGSASAAVRGERERMGAEGRGGGGGGVDKSKARLQAEHEEAMEAKRVEVQRRAHEMLQMKLEDFASSTQQNTVLKEELKRAKEEVELVKEQVATEQAKRLFQVGVLSFKKDQQQQQQGGLHK